MTTKKSTTKKETQATNNEKKNAAAKENNPVQQEQTADPDQKINQNDESVVKAQSEDLRPIVLVVTKDERLAELASTSILKEFETEVRTIVPDFDPEKGLVEKITDLISSFENETVILFDSIVPVNKFYMQDVGTIYAGRTKVGWDYNVKTPVVLERSRIVELLEENPEIADSEFLNAYFRKYHSDVLPTVVDWRNDTFTLPIVTVNPPFATLTEYLNRKRWFYVSDSSVNAVLKFFSE